MIRGLLIFLCIMTSPYVHGQDSAVDDDESAEVADVVDEIPHELVEPELLGTTHRYLEENLAIREFDREKWQAIIGETDYNEEAKPESAPFSMPWAGPLLKVISYIVIISLVIFLLYYITKYITFGLRIERKKLESDDLEAPVENIEALDIDALLEQAQRDGNFRMSIRLYYLRLLKKLNTMGMIVWKKDKTNRDYLSELFSRDFYYREVQRLTVSYEAVWYGEHLLEGEALARLTSEFEGLHRKLHTTRAL